METKPCTTCKKVLSIDQFSKTKRMKSGYSSQCKSCKAKYDKEYRERNKLKLAEKQKKYAMENKEKIAERQERWREKNKEKIKRYREENRERSREYNKHYWAENKQRLKERTNKWREENADHIRQYRKEHKERDKRKAKEWLETEKGNELSRKTTQRRRQRLNKLQNDLTPQEWNKCLNYFDNSCCYCGNKKNLEEEHVIPVIHGGGRTKSNIVVACRICNASKASKSLFEWYPSFETYSDYRMIRIIDYLVENGVTFCSRINTHQKKLIKS